jgi:hypothetical protein
MKSSLKPQPQVSHITHLNSIWRLMMYARVTNSYSYRIMELLDCQVNRFIAASNILSRAASYKPGNRTSMHDKFILYNRTRHLRM